MDDVDHVLCRPFARLTGLAYDNFEEKYDGVRTMAVMPATMLVKTNMVITDGVILAAGEYGGFRIPERPNANASNGKEPASWLLLTGSDRIDVTAFVKSGDITVTTELD